MRTRSWNRPGRVRLTAVVIAVLAVVVVAGAVFQPWRLFVNTRIDKAVPEVRVAPATPGETAEASSPTPGTTLGPAGPTTAGPPPKESAKPAAPTSQVVRSGELISHEHPTSGRVRIIQQPDGTRVLRIEDLDTTNGPDLRVWLIAAPVRDGRDGWFVFKDYDHLELGALKANRGNQNYLLPASADLDEFQRVTIWCKRFAVSFGAAALTAT